MNNIQFYITSISDYMDAPSDISPVNLSANTSNDVNFIQITDKSCISSNLATLGACNISPFKINKQVASGKERKRAVRSAPNG